MLGLGDLQLDEQGRLRLKRGVYLAHYLFEVPCSLLHSLSMPKFLVVMYFVVRSQGSCLPSRTTEALKPSRVRKETKVQHVCKATRVVKHRSGFELTRNVEGGPP